MRMMMSVLLPNEPFNTLVRNGKTGEILEKIMSGMKAEAAYFTEQHGQRSAILIINVTNPAQLPLYSEPWFLNFNAAVEFRIAMSLEDIQEASLDNIAQNWL